MARMLREIWCDANCVHVNKNGKCKLEGIVIDEKGKCKDLKPRPTDEAK